MQCQHVGINWQLGSINQVETNCISIFCIQIHVSLQECKGEWKPQVQFLPQLVNSMAAIGPQHQNSFCCILHAGRFAVGKDEQHCRVIFQMQHFLIGSPLKSSDPQPLLGHWFCYTVPKSYFVQNPKFKGRGVICPYNGCRQTFIFSLENRFSPMPVQQLFQLVLEEAGCKCVKDWVQGAVHWQEKNDYPGSDCAWIRKQSVKNRSLSQCVHKILYTLLFLSRLPHSLKFSLTTLKISLLEGGRSHKLEDLPCKNTS